MFTKFAVLGVTATAQTDAPNVTSATSGTENTVGSAITTQSAAAMSTTGSPGTGSMMTSTGTEVMAPFDHTKNLVNIDLGNCVIAELSSLDAMNLFDSVNDFVMDTCMVSSAVTSVEDMMGSCHIKMMVDDSMAYDTIMQCLITPIDMTYLETVYPISISPVPMSPIVTSPLTVGDIRNRLEAGLVSELMNDSTVVRVTTEMLSSSITDSIDEAITYFNELIVKIEAILNEEDPMHSHSLEVVAIEEDETGMAVLVMRPVAMDLDTEANTLQSLKDQIEDPSSPVNTLINGPATTTSVPVSPSTTMASVDTTVTSAFATTTAEDGTDAALIGGLIGGIAGVAAIGGGAALYRNNQKKKDDADAPIQPRDGSPVMTPNTTHAVNGLLTERTPRNMD